MPEDNPYAEFETAPAAKAPVKAGGNPYAEFETIKPPAAVVTKPQSQAGIDKTMGSQSMLGQLIQNRPEHLAPLSDVIDTGKREVKAAGSALVGMLNPKTYYHALADEPTAQEKKLIGEHGTVGNIIARPGLALARLSSEPLANAAVKGVNIARSSDPVGEALKVAPEAIGTGAGLVVGGKLMGNAAEGTKAFIKDPSLRTAGEATGVSPAIRGTGKVLQHPVVSMVAGPAAVTGVGHALGLPLGEAAEIGAGTGLFGTSNVPRMIKDLGHRMSKVGLEPFEKTQIDIAREIAPINKGIEKLNSQIDSIKQNGGTPPESWTKERDSLINKWGELYDASQSVDPRTQAMYKWLDEHAKEFGIEKPKPKPLIQAEPGPVGPQATRKAVGEQLEQGLGAAPTRLKNPGTRSGIIGHETHPVEGGAAEFHVEDKTGKVHVFHVEGGPEQAARMEGMSWEQIKKEPGVTHIAKINKEGIRTPDRPEKP